MKHQTYDILNVGKNNRFFVMNKDGEPMCVHNCGYGASAGKFAELMKQQGLVEQADMAYELITTYRTANNMISGFWRECQRVLDVMYAGGSCWFGGVNNDLFFADGSSEFYGKKIPSIRLPNGAYIFYQNLRKEAGDDGKVNYVYDQFKGRNWLPKRIWGSAFFFFFIQALAFCILKWQAIEIAKTGLSINLNVHDEWASVVPRNKATDAAIIYYQKMKSVPDYIPQGLLDCEVDVGWNYGTLHTIPSKEIEKCL